MKAFKQLCAGITMLSYMFLALFGLLAMNYIHQHDMSSMRHCPFMAGQQSACSMSTAEHIAAFENTVQATAAHAVLPALPVLLVVFILALRPPSLFFSIRSRFREDFFSTLFSRGILHPKAP